MFEDHQQKKHSRPLGNCKNCGRVSVEMATKDKCVTCYARFRPGRSGKSKDQNLLIKQYNNLVKAFRIIGLDTDEIAQSMHIATSKYLDSIKDYLMFDRQNDLDTAVKVFAAAESSGVDGNETVSTVDQDRSASTDYVDPDENVSTVDQIETKSTGLGVDQDHNQSTTPVSAKELWDVFGESVEEPSAEESYRKV